MVWPSMQQMARFAGSSSPSPARPPMLMCRSPYLQNALAFCLKPQGTRHSARGYSTPQSDGETTRKNSSSILRRSRAKMSSCNTSWTWSIRKFCEAWAQWARPSATQFLCARRRVDSAESGCIQQVNGHRGRPERGRLSRQKQQGHLTFLATRRSIERCELKTLLLYKLC